MARRVRLGGFTLLLGAIPVVILAGREQKASSTAIQPERKVAITFDDLPGAVPVTPNAPGELRQLKRYNHAIPAVLKAHHAPAIGFVNEQKLQVAGERDARVALLQRWIDGGFELGNHTYSHANFNQVALQEMED